MKRKLALLATKFAVLSKLIVAKDWIIVFREEGEVKISHSELDMTMIQQTTGYLQIVTDLKIFEIRNNEL